MNFKKKALGIFGVLTIAASLTSGVAFAEKSTTADAFINVTCSKPLSAWIEAPNATFNVTESTNRNDLQNQVNRNAFIISSETACLWGQWSVNVSVGDFQHTGDAGTGFVQSFAGNTLVLKNGQMTWAGIQGNGNQQPQIVNNPQLTASAGTYSTKVFNSNGNQSSAGAASTTWDASLNNLPLNLASGSYRSTLTVSIATN